jgi:hypothetical protein
MNEIKGLWEFNEKPTQLDTKRVESIIEQPLDKDLEKLCKLLSQD